MKSSVETLEGNKVKVYVEIDETEFETDIESAFRTIAREVKLPGFRNGKAPRKLLEARIGLGPAREQALRDSIPLYLTKAVQEHDVDLIATPSIEITSGEEAGAVEFEAECEVRPEITVPGYGGLRVEIDPIDIDDEAFDAAVADQLKGHGTLEDVDRAAESGDYVTLDMTATRDGEELAGLNIEDWSYEIGQGWVTEDFDEKLIGAKVGEELSFSSTPKGTEEEADFTVKLSAVKSLALPDVDDAWVEENIGEYTDVASWHEAIKEQLSESNLNAVRQTLGQKVTDALVELVDIDAPESMVEQELQGRLQNLVRQFEAQGMDLGAWLSATGQSTEDLIANFREQAESSVKADLALRAIAVAENIEVDGEDLELEYTRLAMQFSDSSDNVRRAYEQNGAVGELTASVKKSKAFDWLLHNIEFVDTNGAQIDSDTVLGRDHDQDHDGETEEDEGEDA